MMRPTSPVRTLVACALAFGSLSAAPAWASKSAEDCEAELGTALAGEARQRALYLCLLGDDAAEVERAEEALRRQRANAAHFVEGLELEVNSAGGVELELAVFNPDRRSPIKYISLTVEVYNAVGDRLQADFGRWRSLQMTGPVRSGFVAGTRFGPIGYARTAHCVKISSLTVDFMDGRKRQFAGAALKAALSPAVTNDCKPAR